MMKKLLAALAFTAASTALMHGQIATFVVERDMLSFADGTAISRDVAGDNRGGISVFGGYINPADAPSIIESLGGAQAKIAAGDALGAISDIESLIAGITWTPINPSSGLVIGTRDWSSPGHTGAEGQQPVMAVMTGSPGSLDITDQLGIVTTADFRLPALGTQVIGFNTSPVQWDTALWGELDSLTLAAIPEPRVYAALFGLFALGFVMWRRRNR